VNIDSREWTAERVCDVPVRGQAVDSGAEGAFCVIFWPDLGSFTDGDQIEIVLTNLRGSSSELTFFYHLVHVGRNELDKAFCVAAERVRGLLGFRELWDEPRSVMKNSPEIADEAHRTLNRARTRRSSFSVARPGTQSLNAQGIEPSIRTVSHHDLTFTTSANDVSIVLWTGGGVCFQAGLYLVRASGEGEVVERASQVWQLADGYMLIWVKLPMPRCRFELRLWTAFGTGTADNPVQLKQHSLKYNIISGDKCQTLLTSMQDALRTKYGLAQFSLASQRYGIMVVAPSSHRIQVGPCYFLVCVDLNVAIAAARADIVTATKDAKATDSQSESLSGRGRDHVATTLFSARLLTHRPPPRQRGRRLTAVPHDIAADLVKPAEEGNEFYTKLRSVLELRCQDSDGEVHLDVALHNGESVYRLQEHPDFRGFYEGSFIISEADVGTHVELSVRFPRVHVSDFARRPLARWVVHRNEHLPLNF
jgi:hypothetical protein